MNVFYDFLMELGENTLRMISTCNAISPNQSKLFRLARGQRGLMSCIRHSLSEDRPDEEKETIWFHVASMGEFAVVRPVIRTLRERRGCRIVVTFFSPTGVEYFSASHPDMDYVFYLPWDTRRNVRDFLDLLRPSKAVFAISEYWVNYLDELHRRHIPVCLISAFVSRRSPFVHWWGGIYRRILRHYAEITVADEHSRRQLLRFGVSRVTLAGDPLFDNALHAARTEWHDDTVRRFSGWESVFVAGSVSDKKDLRLVADLANRHPDIRFIIVPHEISEENLLAIIAALDGRALLYSECDVDTDFRHVQTLVVDTMGMLAYIYRYAEWTYVGGGFTPYLHSVVEPAAYGVPMAFGPEVSRKVSARQLVESGAARIVRNANELDSWFTELRHDEAKQADARRAAAEYVRANEGATARIVDIINRAGLSSI